MSYEFRVPHLEFISHLDGSQRKKYHNLVLLHYAVFICRSSETYKAKKTLPIHFCQGFKLTFEPKGHVRYCLSLLLKVSVNFNMLTIFSNHRRNFHYNVHYSADGLSSNMKTTTETRFPNVPKADVFCFLYVDSLFLNQF